MLTTVRFATCAGVVTVTAAERALLSSLPDGAHPVSECVWCELESGHLGPHHGLGQISAATWWWLRWSDDGAHREFVDAGFCGAHPEIGAGDCSLPDGHTGGHSFHLDAAD